MDDVTSEIKLDVNGNVVNVVTEPVNRDHLSNRLDTLNSAVDEITAQRDGVAADLAKYDELTGAQTPVVPAEPEAPVTPAPATQPEVPATPAPEPAPAAVPTTPEAPAPAVTPAPVPVAPEAPVATPPQQ